MKIQKQAQAQQGLSSLYLRPNAEMQAHRLDLQLGRSPTESARCANAGPNVNPASSPLAAAGGTI